MSNLQEVVRYVRSALDHKCVFVHMTAPQLETLLAGLEELQRENTSMKNALEWINDYRESLPSSAETYQFAEAFLMAEDKAAYALSTLTKEESA